MDKLQEIFAKQMGLIEKYHPIEHDNGLLWTADIPVDLHDKFGQARLKDMAWRITEELGETLDACMNKPKEEYQEEVIDILHFLVEFSILSGYRPDQNGLVDRIDKDKDRLDNLFDLTKMKYLIKDEKVSYYYEDVLFQVGVFVQSLAMTCNLLKNKAWKVTHRDTDIKEFYHRLENTWFKYIELCLISGINAQTAYELYVGKHNINQKRIQEGY